MANQQLVVRKDKVFAGATPNSVLSPSFGWVQRRSGLMIRGPFNIGTFNAGIAGGLGASVHVEGCAISGFSIGIAFPGSGSNQLFVKDTTIKNCGVQTTTTSAAFDNCRIEGNGTGLLAGVGTKGDDPPQRRRRQRAGAHRGRGGHGIEH